MLRRLSPIQPDSFEFTPANLDWARAQMTKYPEGRQQSAVIPVLWRAQEQQGWLTRPAIEYCADLLGMPYIRALEVATFYFMFQLQPVGSVAHIQICGTTTCMICGAGELIAVCREKIAPQPHMLSEDGKFSWEEVECLAACANAPMAQIGKDYYEDLTAEKLAQLIDAMAAGKVPVPGPQDGRFSSEPKTGQNALMGLVPPTEAYNASVALAVDLKDTLKRIDGTEVPILTPWLGKAGLAKAETRAEAAAGADDRAAGQPAITGRQPKKLDAPEGGQADDLKDIDGVGPVLEGLLHSLGIYHFHQIANWDDAEIAWVDENLEGFHGRVSRDEWVRQAQRFVKERENKTS